MVRKWNKKEKKEKSIRSINIVCNSNAKKMSTSFMNYAAWSLLQVKYVLPSGECDDNVRNASHRTVLLLISLIS